jgi:hypothetical protein
MRFRALISLFLVLAFASGLWASEIELLKTTPYVDVARNTLQRIDYALKDGSMKPTDALLDALIPIVENEPYLLKDALEVLYDLPEQMLYSRDDLFKALNRWKDRGEVIEFLSQRGGPQKKEILMDVAIHGSEEEADRAVAELTRMPLNREDIKRLIEGYLTRKTWGYPVLAGFLRNHPEILPSLNEKTLRRVQYLLQNDGDCLLGVRLFSASGTSGHRLLFKAWYQGRIAGSCEYVSYEALRQSAEDIAGDVLSVIATEGDPVIKGRLVVLLLQAGRLREARHWAETLTEEGALQLINAFSGQPEKLRRARMIGLLKSLNRGRLTGPIENLRKALVCYDLKGSKKETLREVLSKLSDKDTGVVVRTLDDINYCKTHPERLREAVIALAGSSDERVSLRAFRVLSGRRPYCSLVDRLKPLLSKPSSGINTKAETLGFVGFCRAWDEESVKEAVSLLERAEPWQKDIILRALTSTEVFPEDALREIERMYGAETDPNMRLSLLYVYLRGLSRTKEGVKRIARMLARGEIDDVTYSAHVMVPDKLKATFGRAVLEELHWWDDWMIQAIDIPADIKAESLIRTSLRSVDKPFEEMLKRLEEAAKLSESVAIRFRRQLLDIFKNNTKGWLASSVQTPTLNRMLGPEGKRVLLEFYLKKGLFHKISEVVKYYYSRFFKRSEPLYVSNTSGFVPLPANRDTVEFYATYLKKINRKDTHRFNIIIDAIRESLLSVDQGKRGVFRPLVPLLKRQIVDTMDQDVIYTNATLRELIGMITGKTPPPTEAEKRYQKGLSGVPLEKFEHLKENALKEAKRMPLPFKIDTTKEYLLPDGQRILVMSFVLPEGYGIIEPQESFCIDYDKEYPEGVGMDEPSDKPYRWYVYKLIRKGYNKPVKVEFYWSRDFGMKKGMLRGLGDYRYYLPRKVYKSVLSIKQRPPEKFSLKIMDDANGRVIETPFPVQDIWYQSRALKPLDGREGRDCKQRFKADTLVETQYLRVLLSSASGYSFEP